MPPTDPPDGAEAGRPAGVVGRDEMNLAEFPIALLADRSPRGRKTLHFQDKHERLTVTGGDAYGLPTAADADVIVALIYLTKQRNNGVSAKTAADLAARHPAAAVARKAEVLDWLVERKDKRVAKSPSGYLVKSIEDGYADPKGFVPEAERLRPEGAHDAGASRASEEARGDRQRRTQERAKDGRDAAYWGSLTPSQQAALQAEADAGADPSDLARESGPLGKVGRRVRLNAYLRAKLDAEAGGAAPG